MRAWYYLVVVPVHRSLMIEPIRTRSTRKPAGFVLAKSTYSAVNFFVCCPLVSSILYTPACENKMRLFVCLTQHNTHNLCFCVHVAASQQMNEPSTEEYNTNSNEY